VKHYKWRLFLIAISLIGVSIVFFYFNDHHSLADHETRAYLDDLKLLSQANIAQRDVPAQEILATIKQTVNQLELHISQNDTAHKQQINHNQVFISLVILLIFIYLSYVLLRVLSTSKQIEQSNSRIKSEIAKIQTTFASIGDALITTDLNGTIDYMNKSAEELTQFSYDEHQPQAIHQVFRLCNEENDPLSSPVDRAIAEKQIIKGKKNILLQRKDNTRIPIVYTIAPIHDSSSQIIGTIIVFHDISEAHKLTQALSWQATHDALTRLPNRVLLKDKLEQSLSNTDKHDNLLTLFFIDLDGFKPVNDKYGHEQGDKVLKIIAKRLLETIRNDDLVARLGGDEFVITLLSFTNKDEITNALDRVMSTISQPIPVGSDNIVLSASIGVTLYPDDPSDADTLLRHADQAMYIAKQQGRNQYHFFDVQSNHLSTRKEMKRQRIEYALTHNELFLVYQPKVNMRTGDIYGLEVLLRWQHPQSGVVSPEKFLSICEDTELIIQIGDWVFNKALSQLRKWHVDGFDFHLAINIAPKQFQAPDFIDKLDNLLAKYSDIPAHFIELEVVESAALQDISMVSSIIEACHNRNIKVALDDFGTGYASLSYLKQLPADQLKIDKSFIQDMLEDEGDRGIVEGIISLARIFDRQVIAEGVESKEHGVMLLRLGCDIAQGFGISKPLVADEVIRWSESWVPDPNWILWSETPWDISDFPLLIAQSDHFAGINNIITSVSEYEKGQEVFDLLSHEHCRLGTWYYGIGKEKYGHLDSFDAVEESHRLTHELGKKMLQLTRDGQNDQAKALIPELIKIRDDVLEKLNQLQADILQQMN
jgi:diguanylate cyclase (GGDEF)-like protein/PAS domain S-box-containing protein